MMKRNRIAKSIPNLFFILLICLVSVSFQACNDGPEDVPLDEIDLQLKVHRFDEDMHAGAMAYRNTPNADSSKIYQEHFAAHRAFIIDWMFQGQDSLVTDSILTLLMQEFTADPHGQVLLDTIHKHFAAEGLDIEGALTPPMKRFHYYFPNKAVPAIVTYVDGYPPTAQAGLDQVFISPRFIGIGLHYLMGRSFKYYPPDLPQYIRRRMTVPHMPSLVVHRLADAMIPRPSFQSNPALIDYVVREGIKMHFVDRLLGPEVHDSLKLFYNATQLEWANSWEARAYKDLTEDLYKVDAVLVRRYVDDSPFTSQLNRQSAPRLGAFLGWKIVNSYMEKNPDVGLDALIADQNYRKIFRESKYRPSREKSE